MRWIVSLVACLPIVALGACGGSSDISPSGVTAASTSAPAAGGGGGSCQGHHVGEAGVIATNCDGTAVIRVVSGSARAELRGGTCAESTGLLVVNVGVVTTHEFVGARPDAVSVNTPPAGGSGPDVGASILLGGKFYGDSGRFGGTTTVSADHHTIHFTGSATDGEAATIDVTC